MLLLREVEPVFVLLFIDIRLASMLSRFEGPLTDFRLIRELRLDGSREPMGLYKDTWLFRRHDEPKLKASSFSLCSFLTGARYFGLGMGSSGL